MLSVNVTNTRDDQLCFVSVLEFSIHGHLDLLVWVKQHGGGSTW